MKRSICLGTAIVALTMTLQTSPAPAFLWGLTEGSTCSDDWPTWKKLADPVAYGIWKATCLDAAGTGTDETLGTSRTGSRKSTGYDGDPSKGFGSDIPVTLPPDRRRLGGTNTGIPVTRGVPPQINQFAKRPVIR